MIFSGRAAAGGARVRVPGGGSASARLGVGSAGLLALALLVFPALVAERQERPRTASCPVGALADARRAAGLAGALARTRRGGPLLAAAPAALAICFRAGGEPGLVRPDLVLLDPALGDGEAAALLGHLLLHATEPPFAPEEVDPALPCDRVVEAAVAAEARAHALEVELRGELGVRPASPRLPFERSCLEAGPEACVELVRAHLLAEPAGDDGPPGLAELYRRRCERTRAEAGGPGS